MRSVACSFFEFKIFHQEMIKNISVGIIKFSLFRHCNSDLQKERETKTKTIKSVQISVLPISAQNVVNVVVSGFVLIFIITSIYYCYFQSWCFYYLALHPEIQENVYQELSDVLGDEEIQPLVSGKLE